MLVFLEYARSFRRRCLDSWEAERREHYGEPSHKPLYNWIRVSQVCKHWRKVALDCAELWTLLVLDERIHPQLYKTILERSCGLPLTIILHATHNVLCCPGRCQPEAVRQSNYATAMDLFRRVLVNARNLSIFIDRHDHRDVWKALRSLKRAEGLQSLRIRSLGYARFNDPPDVSAPGNLIAPPSLRSLKITHVAFMWSNTLLGPNIRHLDLSKHYFRVFPTVDELLSALERMQQLETLFLDQVPSEEFLPEGYTRQANVPCLRLLRVPLESPASSTLLPFLQLPPTTSVDLYKQGRKLISSRNRDEKIPEEMIVALAKATVRILKDLVVYATDGSRFSYDKPSCTFWAGLPQDLDTSMWQPWKDVGATPYRLNFGASLQDPVMTAILAAIDLQHVHMLSIWDDNPYPARALLESVRAAANLTTLSMGREACIPIGAILAGWRRPPSMDANVNPRPDDDDRHPDWYGYGTPGDCDGILDDPGKDSGSAVGAVASDTGASQVPVVCAAPLFPRLQTLRLSGVDFPGSDLRPRESGRSRRIWDACYGDIEHGLDVRGLVKALRTRVARGAEEIVRLELDDCQCTARERLVPLVDVVPEVWLEGKRVTIAELGASDA